MHVLADTIAHDPAQLLPQIDHAKITIFQTVPSMLHAILNDANLYGAARPRLDSLRWLISTGEALPAQLCRRWISHYPRIPLLNAYGPTECSDDVAHHPIHWPPPKEAVHVPIGRPIAGAALYVLDAWQQPVAEGSIGELYIGGVCVGLGYLNDPQRTAAAFVPDPFDPASGARLYRSGDLVKYLPTGELVFIGRRDQQTKVNGVRIELGEIEQTLRQYPSVQDCVVVARQAEGEPAFLAAYVVARPGTAHSGGELLSYLRLHLPQYMIPATFTTLDAIPLTANGKVDRTALPAPLGPPPGADRGNGVAPSTELERAICAIWADILNQSHIGIFDDFFVIGGRSLDAIRVTARINQTFHSKLPVAQIYRAPTVHGIARYLGQAAGTGACAMSKADGAPDWERRNGVGMDFLGKWTIKAAGGGYVTLDPASGQLDTSGQTEGAAQKFNAYGAGDQFMLQAANGKYVVGGDGGYTATLERTGAVTYFRLEGDAGAVRVLDLGVGGAGADQYYWNAEGDKLQRVKAAADPPPSTVFNQCAVTPGLSDILSNSASAGSSDLTWAYLAGVDFSSVLGFFVLANLQHATLTNANFDGVDLSRADLSFADLQHATLRGISADLSGAILNGADLSHADLSSATIVDKAQLLGARLAGVNLGGSTIENADFTGATLTDADFSGATVSGCNFSAAMLAGAKLSNPAPDPSPGPPHTLAAIDLSKATGTQFSALTNFANAQLRYNDLTGFDFSSVVMNGADLTGCKMDNTILAGTELSYANLSNVSLTGNINMHAANFANATLTEADMTGAQLGGISLQFFVPEGSDNFGKLLQGLQQDDTAAVVAVFRANRVDLEGSVIINASQGAQDRVWTVERTLPAQTTFTIRLETAAGRQSLRVYQSANTAILTNAFMKGVILTSANLYNVRASGAQLYGGAKLDGNAILESIQLDRANLAGLNLSQARMYGANLDYANLVGATLQGAQLTPSSDGGQATLNSAQLQGVDFTDAQLDGAILTDAAVAVAVAPSPPNTNGVWLFDAGPGDANLCIPELDAAVNGCTLDQFAGEAAALLPVLAAGKIPAQLVAAYSALSPKIAISPDSLLTVLTSDTYWQVVDGSRRYVIFHSCDASSNTPALGVAPGAAFTIQAQFTIPLSLERGFTSGAAGAALAAAFQQQGITLSPAATLTIAHQATDFQIVQPKGPSYLLWLGLQAGSAGCGYALYTRPAIPNVTALFANHSLPLSSRTTVASVGPTLWNVINDDGNPFNPVTNYVEFFVCSSNSGGGMSVYGSFLRVQRLSASNQYEYHNFPCALTALADTQLQPNTVCPNSLRKSVNLTNQLPVAQWMRAKSLPKAPACIPDPDGMFSCPE